MKLSDKQLEVISKVVIEHLESERQNQEKKKYDRRLRNIKLLLRNYRSFVKHCKDIKLEIDILNEKLEIEYLDSNEFIIQSIKQSKEKTLAMVKYIDKMLAVYKAMCEEDGDEAKRQYQVIRALYIDNPKKSIKEVSDVHFLSEKTIRRDRDKGCEALAVLMFGVDVVRLNRA